VALSASDRITDTPFIYSNEQFYWSLRRVPSERRLPLVLSEVVTCQYPLSILVFYNFTILPLLAATAVGGGGPTLDVVRRFSNVGFGQLAASLHGYGYRGDAFDKNKVLDPRID
jgi:hypothetical protein